MQIRNEPYPTKDCFHESFYKIKRSTEHRMKNKQKQMINLWQVSTKELNEKSRDCHNQKPQPEHDTKTKRKNDGKNACK